MSAFLIGSIGEVSRRISQLNNKLQNYTELVVESRASQHPELVPPSTAVRRERVQRRGVQNFYSRTQICRIYADGGIYPIYTRKLLLFCIMGTENFMQYIRLSDITESDVSEFYYTCALSQVRNFFCIQEHSFSSFSVFYLRIWLFSLLLLCQKKIFRKMFLRQEIEKQYCVSLRSSKNIFPSEFRINSRIKKKHFSPE